MRDVAWHAIGRDELAQLLSEASRIASRGIGATTVYELEHDGHGIVAMALPDGHALVIERAPLSRWRRRMDAEHATPASR